MAESRFVIDRDAVAAQVAGTRALLDRGYRRWFLRQFFFNLLFLYVIVAVARLGELPRIGDWSAGRLAFSVGFPIGAALLLTWWAGRQRFRPAQLDVELRIQEIAGDLRKLGGPGWLRRSLAMGVAVGVGIGMPVGVMMTVFWRPEDLPTANRLLTIPVFVAITLVWCVPATLLLRWMTLLALKRMVREVSPDA